MLADSCLQANFRLCRSQNIREYCCKFRIGERDFQMIPALRIGHAAAQDKASCRSKGEPSAAECGENRRTLCMRGKQRLCQRRDLIGSLNRKAPHRLPSGTRTEFRIKPDAAADALNQLREKLRKCFTFRLQDDLGSSTGAQTAESRLKKRGGLPVSGYRSRSPF